MCHDTATHLNIYQFFIQICFWFIQKIPKVYSVHPIFSYLTHIFTWKFCLSKYDFWCPSKNEKFIWLFCNWTITISTFLHFDIKCSCFREIMNIHGMNFEFIESGMFYMNWSFYENMTLQLHYKYVNYSTIKTPKSWRNCHNGMTIVEWRTVVDCCIYWDESHRT